MQEFGGKELSASLEISLYIGLLKTRFDEFDDVKLKLKDGTIVEGTIEPFESTNHFTLDTKEGRRMIYPEDIEDYVV